MRDKSNPEVATPREQQITLLEVASAVSPGYHPAGLPSYAAELVEAAEGLGMTVGRDWGDRPVVSEADARALFLHLTQPRPAVVEQPTRGHVPGVTQADPSSNRSVEVY
jgi:hypothetical protein